MVNSIYDPPGLAAPVLLEGRLLLQQLVSMGKESTAATPPEWDDPLPDKLTDRRERWRNALPELENPESLCSGAITLESLEQSLEPRSMRFQTQVSEQSRQPFTSAHLISRMK